MQDPPRGGYYPANGTAGTALQPRQYQYSATNPWQREEREKVRGRLLDERISSRKQICKIIELSHDLIAINHLFRNKPAEEKLRDSGEINK